MPVDSAIADALLTYLGTVPFSPSVPIAYPDIAFDKPEPTVSPAIPQPWLRATLLPADARSLGIAPSASNLYQGLLQVDVFYPQGYGAIKPRLIADVLVSHFKKGTAVFADGTKISVIAPPSCDRLMQDPPWTMTPVRIRWAATAPNA